MNDYIIRNIAIGRTMWEMATGLVTVRRLQGRDLYHETHIERNRSVGNSLYSRSFSMSCHRLRNIHRTLPSIRWVLLACTKHS